MPRSTASVRYQRNADRLCNRRREPCAARADEATPWRMRARRETPGTRKAMPWRMRALREGPGTRKAMPRPTPRDKKGNVTRTPPDKRGNAKA